MRSILQYTALWALPSLINAVAISDMKPRASGLPDDCESVYTRPIPACTPNDFRTAQCSQKCIAALQAMVSPIREACGNQGVSGQNLVVAFLAGVGPQQLCHNAPAPAATTTKKSKPTKSPPATYFITSSTLTASEPPKQTGTLLVDTSSSLSQTVGTSTRRPHHAATTSPASSSAAPQSTSQTSTSSSSTKTKTSDASEETSLDDGSGGGSPFDTEGNMMNSAPGLSTSTLSILLPAAAAAVLTILR